MVGASGAISGVKGAYQVLYPKASVDTLFHVLILFRVVPLPAWVILVSWFVIWSVSTGAGAGAGVVNAAHVGAFVAGIALVPPFTRRRPGGSGRAELGAVLEDPHGRGW